MKNIFLKGIILLLFIFNIFSASWYPLNKDISFSSDIARDFLLFREIDQKKIMLIGPRSSVPGLYHGPLWLYLNYPAYILGKGNPIIVGWYWVFLIFIFSLISYFIAKKLFGSTAGALYLLINSSYLIHHSKGLFNPHGALFFLPIFFFFFIKYLETNKIRYLISHAITAGFLVQFQIAIGGPFLILSFLYILIRTLRNHQFNHLAIYFLTILISLSTFIIFEVRHGFLLTKSVIGHFLIRGGDPRYNYLHFIINRFKLMTQGVQFVTLASLKSSNLYILLIFIYLVFLQIKNNIHRRFYFVFLYFFLGFFPLTLVNRYDMLPWYFFPIIPFVFLAFVSLVTSKYKRSFLILFSCIYIVNILSVFQYIRESKNFIGKNRNSWKALFRVASEVYSQKDKSFGYFVYAPDSFGYGPKYTMKYTSSLSHQKSYNFQKKPVTYVVIEPPPPDKPWMKAEWWIENQINIHKNAEWTQKFDSGYEIKKYLLNEKEVKIPFNPTVNPGIHFR